jgi:hypothetical protein
MGRTEEERVVFTSFLGKMVFSQESFKDMSRIIRRRKCVVCFLMMMMEEMY